MPRFRIDDARFLEDAPSDASTLRSRLNRMINRSTDCRATVDAINPETGEYRVVLEGRLDKEDLEDEEL